jgi:hypothetical protein
MSTHLRAATLIVSAALTVSALVVAPAAAAPDHQLSAAGLEQTVLRAQMPSALGAWRQNIYFAEKNAAPYVCWSATGSPVELPKAANVGGVGYEVNRNISSGVMIFQYRDGAEAQAAVTALKAVDCPDMAKVGDDGPATAVTADQGADYTDASLTGFVSSVSYQEQGTPVTTTLRTTVRGLAVVQTMVTVAGKASSAKGRGKAAALNTRWHRQVLAAYEAFGSGSSR